MLNSFLFSSWILFFWFTVCVWSGMFFFFADVTTFTQTHINKEHLLKTCLTCQCIKHFECVSSFSLEIELAMHQHLLIRGSHCFTDWHLHKRIFRQIIRFSLFYFEFLTERITTQAANVKKISNLLLAA